MLRPKNKTKTKTNLIRYNRKDSNNVSQKKKNFKVNCGNLWRVINWKQMVWLKKSKQTQWQHFIEKWWFYFKYKNLSHSLLKGDSLPMRKTKQTNKKKKSHVPKNIVWIWNRLRVEKVRISSKILEN